MAITGFARPRGVGITLIQSGAHAMTSSRSSHVASPPTHRSNCLANIAADQFRLSGSSGWRDASRLLLTTYSFRYLVVFRLAGHFYARRRHRYSPAYLVLRTIHRHLSVRYGYELPISTQVGPGLYLSHLGPIIVNYKAILGRNVNLSTGVVIGRASRGERQGAPTIGDRVYVGPGAKVFGEITIGDDAAIGANAVVSKDVPPGVSVAGIPASIVSARGSEGYVNRLAQES